MTRGAMRARRSAGARLLACAVVLVGALGACSGRDEEPAIRPTGAAAEGSARAPRAPRVSRAEQETGLARCGDLLADLGPANVPTFSTLMRECAGLYAVRECRDALRAEEFSRPRVHETCSLAYCDELRERPSFCTRELPSDAEFLVQFADFSQAVLRRDLRRVMEREGAEEIATLMAQLIRDQASQ
jgi:hypothetical protein